MHNFLAIFCFDHYFEVSFAAARLNFCRLDKWLAWDQITYPALFLRQLSVFQSHCAIQKRLRRANANSGFAVPHSQADRGIAIRFLWRANFLDGIPILAERPRFPGAKE